MKPDKNLNYNVLGEIESRWSGRAFSDKKLDKETILQLIEAARWAPSSYNEQPWHFIIGMKESENFEKIFDTLMSANREWAQNAGALILTVSISELSRNGKANKFANYDLGQAVAYLNLEAERINLNIHQMGGFDAEKASQAFNIQQPYKAMSVIAVGYRGKTEELSETLQEREASPQSRKELEQIVSFDGFQK